jgi:hypothetical protein
MSVTGAWRIVEMDLWDAEAIDLLGPGYIQFDADRTGHFRFIAVEGWMDCQSGHRRLGPPTRSATTCAPTTRAILPAAVAGRRWRRTGRCGGISISTWVMTPASGRCMPGALRPQRVASTTDGSLPARKRRWMWRKPARWTQGSGFRTVALQRCRDRRRANLVQAGDAVRTD